MDIKLSKTASYFLITLVFLLLTACGGSNNQTDTSSKGIKVQVTEKDFKITSSLTKFSPGAAYNFVITNEGQAAHEFMIMPKSEGSMQGMQMTNMDSQALVSLGMLNPGETKTLSYTFSASLVGTHPEFACYLPGHYEAGMRLGATVYK